MEQPGVHQITFMDEGPDGLVRLAAQIGLRQVCLFTHSPQLDDGSDMFPVVNASDIRTFRQLLADRDVSITNAEYFPVMPELDIRTYLPALDIAAELGAKRIVTHIYETDEERITVQLGQLCEAAAQRQLLVGLEFTGFAAGCNNLSSAAKWHSVLGQRNLQIAIDALHFFRTGGTVEELETMEPSAIGYAQICDGHDLAVRDDYAEEAMFRMIPGEGAFPLLEFLLALPPDIDLDIEVPGPGGTDSRERAIAAIIAGRQLIEQARTIT